MGSSKNQGVRPSFVASPSVSQPIMRWGRVLEGCVVQRVLRGCDCGLRWSGIVFSMVCSVKMVWSPWFRRLFPRIWAKSETVVTQWVRLSEMTYALRRGMLCAWLDP